MEQRYGDPSLASRMRRDLSVPMIVAPMFLVSGPDLVVECCRAGIVGSMPALNARTGEILDEWLGEIGGRLAEVPSAAPYAVNLIVHATNRRLDADIDLCALHKVPIIIAAVGSPAGVIDKVKGYGGLVFSDAGSVRHARRAAESGVDGIILLCAGAGGNTGWMSPFSFVSEVRRFFDGPIILAGAISRGLYVHVAEVMGADMALVGTSFIAARESLADPAYRDMLVDSNADDIITTTKVTGIPANMLRASLERANFDLDAKAGGFDMDHELTTLRAWRDIWSAGHGVGDVTRVETAAEIVARFREEYDDARQGNAVPSLLDRAAIASAIASPAQRTPGLVTP